MNFKRFSAYLFCLSKGSMLICTLQICKSMKSDWKSYVNHFFPLQISSMPTFGHSLKCSMGSSPSAFVPQALRRAERTAKITNMKTFQNLNRKVQLEVGSRNGLVRGAPVWG